MNHLSLIPGPDERLDEVNERIRLIQKRRGLTFGTDSYLLAAFIRPQPYAEAVELGSGSGIVSLLLCAKGKLRCVTAVEVQPALAELTARNAALNGYGDRIRVIGGDLRRLAPDRPGGEVNLVFANPPYLKPDSGRPGAHEQKEIARREIYGGIRDFCAAGARLLRTGGRFVCVFRAERLPDLFGAMRACRLEPKRMAMVHSDADAPPFLVLTEAVKGAAPSLRVLPALMLYRPQTAAGGRRSLTPEAEAIYRTCSFPDAGKYR